MGGFAEDALLCHRITGQHADLDVLVIRQHWSGRPTAQALCSLYGGKRSRWVKKSSPHFEIGRHHYEYHRYEHPGIGRVELKRKQVNGA